MVIKRKTKVRVKCIQCPNCKDIIYSRARHDFHFCSCGDTSVDGGFDYLHYGARQIELIKPFYKYIQGETRASLYEDWNKRIDKYGVIKPENRIITGVRVEKVIWAFKKQFLLAKQLEYKIHYDLDGSTINLLKPLMNRKDFRIFKWFFTIFERLVIEYEVKSK